MIDYERGLYVRIQQLDKGPHPFPLDHGFSDANAYRVLGIYNPSESGECWLILANDRDELWYISQRHVRAWKLLHDHSMFRVSLETDTSTLDPMAPIMRSVDVARRLNSIATPSLREANGTLWPAAHSIAPTDKVESNGR